MEYFKEVVVQNYFFNTLARLTAHPATLPHGRKVVTQGDTVTLIPTWTKLHMNTTNNTTFIFDLLLLGTISRT